MNGEGKNLSCLPCNITADSMYLFDDEIPVSEQDISDWLDTIPNLSATHSRRMAYAKAYNVEEKIRTAKRNGTWPLFSK